MCFSFIKELKYFVFSFFPRVSFISISQFSSGFLFFYLALLPPSSPLFTISEISPSCIPAITHFSVYFTFALSLSLLYLSYFLVFFYSLLPLSGFFLIVSTLFFFFVPGAEDFLRRQGLSGQGFDSESYRLKKGGREKGKKRRRREKQRKTKAITTTKLINKGKEIETKKGDTRKQQKEEQIFGKNELTKEN